VKVFSHAKHALMKERPFQLTELRLQVLCDVWL
jgi:hypothetical protein